MTFEFKKLLAFAIVLSVIISASVGTLAALVISNQKNVPINTIKEQMKVQVVDQQSAVIDAVNKVSPAVVSIIITKNLSKLDQYGPLMNDPFFRQFFGDQLNNFFNDASGTPRQQEVGGGTGFIITPDGYIVTNKHVVADKEAEYTVLLDKERKYKAKILARDSGGDLAVLKIDAQNLPTVELGDSSSLKVGQTVVAIGNALGEFRNTVSTGVVSGLARSIKATTLGDGSTENLIGVIQTDASINPGNSGGPLLDIEGKVVGINTAIVQGAQGIGFAISINEVKGTIENVKKTGRIIRPWLGVRSMTVNSTIVQSNNLAVDYGAIITHGLNLTDLAVVPGSPADRAGLKENDIILEVDGNKLNQDNTLTHELSKRKVGDEITLKIMRKGEKLSVKVMLGEAK